MSVAPLNPASRVIYLASVALDMPLMQSFDFAWPTAWPPPSQADIGRLVAVPFGRASVRSKVDAAGRASADAAAIDIVAVEADAVISSKTIIGIVMALPLTTDVPSDKLRSIDEIIIEVPALSPEVMALFNFCQRYYHAPFGQIAINAIPPALRSKAYKKSTRKPRASASTATENTEPSVAPVLNDEQQRSVNAIVSTYGSYAAFLLEGITGSGKTEVYLHLIAEALKRGKQALILVPEINLTPAFLRHVSARFPANRIAPAHSGMAAMARLHHWLAAQSGEADIVVGTRLSVFTPMPRLGLIVIDEEHDSSFKQQDGVRYSARDVAIFRASGLQCPIVLGSATPSIETIANASRGKFKRLKLQKRAVANAELPKVNFIHLDSEKAPHGLTGSLIDQLKATLARGEQAMVFINRRGYSPALVCGTCGWMPECTRCSARMVFHRAINKLKCHHCGFARRAPSVCGHCGSDDLRAAGQGSERIEDALFEALPGARIARVDRDATRLKGSAEKIFADAAAGKIDILVGTQMLAKGHDFPRLTLVGVVNADGAVFSADFRAAERMAQLLMQVAGRAGRAALPGRVLIQTRFPEHPVYQAVAGHEYAGFVAAALGERKLMQLPPYSYLALLKAESKDEAKLDLFLTQAQAAAAVALKELSQSEPDCDVRVWEPVAATLARKAGYMRKQLMLQSAHRSVLQLFLTRWMADIRSMPARQVKWVIDVDPIEL